MHALPTKQNLPFWLLAIALFSAFVMTALVTQGLGGDGVVYAAIAWNMAHGIGSLWHPYYLAPFYEHPPLAFYLESLFFKLLGDHFWIEKLYSGLTAVISIFAILKIWGLSTRSSWHYAWLPIMFWMTVGDNLDAYKNNLLENTLVCFSTWAAFVLLRSLVSNRQRLVSLITAALLLTAALITKGPQCLFVVMSILLYWLTFRNITFWRAIIDTVILIGCIALFLALILCYKPAYQDLHQYWLEQFWATVSGMRTGGYVGWERLYVLWLLFQYLVALMLLTPLLIFIQAKYQQLSYKSLLITAIKNRWFLFYLILGLLASLPVMLSSRLQEPYILQSFPFFILAAAQILTPIITQWVRMINLNSRLYRRLLLISLMLLTIALINVILSYGKVAHHKDLLSDVLTIGKIVPRNSVVSVNVSVIQSADVVQAYFYRYWQIKLTTLGQCHYYLISKTDQAPVNYLLVPVFLQKFVLYQNPNKQCRT